MSDQQSYSTIHRLFGLILMFSFLHACSSDSNKANLLNPEVKFRSDTMFAKYRRYIIREQDSLCLLKTDELIRISTDSILAINRRQIDKIIGRE